MRVEPAASFDIEVPVAVIGAGAAGLVAALLVANAWLCGRQPDVTIRSLVLALSGGALGFAIVMIYISK